MVRNPFKRPAPSAVLSKRRAGAFSTTLPQNKKQLATLAGGLIKLRLPLKSGGLRKVPRPPAYCRNLAYAIASSSFVPERRLNFWLLVLASRRIPYILQPRGDRSRLYVPALYEPLAVKEIREFEKERPFVPPPDPPLQAGMSAGLFFLAPLLLHVLRVYSSLFPFPAAEWPSLFGLDAYRTSVLHEWRRCASALFIHADLEHLAGNILFGTLLLGFTARRIGTGNAAAAAVLAGILGNVANALFRPADFVSVGLSTAIFGTLGVLCAVTARDGAPAALSGPRVGLIALLRPLIVPLASGLALLGILGGPGERVDYAAHGWGFFMGLCIGAAGYRCFDRSLSSPHRRFFQTAAFVFAVSVPLAALLYGMYR